MNILSAQDIACLNLVYYCPIYALFCVEMLKFFFFFLLFVFLFFHTSSSWKLAG